MYDRAHSPSHWQSANTRSTLGRMLMTKDDNDDPQDEFQKEPNQVIKCYALTLRISENKHENYIRLVKLVSTFHWALSGQWNDVLTKPKKNTLFDQKYWTIVFPIYNITAFVSLWITHKAFPETKYQSNYQGKQRAKKLVASLMAGCIPHQSMSF